ncbi:hypothetical protein [Streptacidiphilus fuscans]|uniref:Uncharacterized protein n=1 Tax=Streptacidiphilus fuscans TaxID=2789292 RepID=A0A931FC02_9ACTN|nr:hypothetical protein [Streptacidiphilus fuscans]MBF9066680.1 hypothetical protein [Streptacidiphilus fuscans]
MGSPFVFRAGHSDARMVVHRVNVDAAGVPYRRVELLGMEVGRAYSLDDVKAIMVRCGMDPAAFDQHDVVEWLGDGPGVWQH